mmetsp:Transcript_43685/g.92874  ORF Transcript_43685/g.92874 Transcript_43685/m.92874 type:complete len:207 (+) Transcript_43685:430-1050(+)
MALGTLSTFTITAWYHRPVESMASTVFFVIGVLRGSPFRSSPRRRRRNAVSSSAILRAVVAFAAASLGHVKLPSFPDTANSIMSRIPSESPTLSTEWLSAYASHLSPYLLNDSAAVTGISAWRFLHSKAHGPYRLVTLGTLPWGTSNRHSLALPSPLLSRALGWLIGRRTTTSENRRDNGWPGAAIIRIDMGPASPRRYGCAGSQI